MSEERKVVSTEVITCHRLGDEGVEAVIIVFDDGTVKVRCEGCCRDCYYEDLEEA